jgi:hypothetical protein
MFSKIRPCVLATLLLLFLSPAALAQLSGPGLFWQDSAGGSAGSFLPECVSHPVAVPPAALVTVQVWGDSQAPFGLFASLSQGPCVPIPGIGGGLLLNPPVFPVASGVLSELSPCLSCPPAFVELHAQIPPTAPPGAQFSLQALSFGGGEPAFTVGIAVTVQ